MSTADVTDALSSPPADDVREALARTFWEAAVLDNPEGVPGESWEELLSEEPAWAEGFYSQADATLATFEVRLRGTVTEPISEALLAVRDEIVRNEGRADAACLATLEAIAAGVWPRGTVTDAEVEAAVQAFWAHPDPTGGPISMRAALEAARGARVSAENTTPTNHPDGSL